MLTEERKEELRAAQRKGSAFLAEKYGADWRKRITRPMDIRSNDCVLIQVTGVADFFSAEIRAGLYSATGAAAEEHGFYLTLLRDQEEESYAFLQELWDADIAGT